MAVQGVTLRVFGRSDTGKVRKKNEDTFVIADLMQALPIHAMLKPIVLNVEWRGVLIAVSDGMGGARAGEVASAMTLHGLRLEMPSGEGGTAEAALRASVEKANQDVWQAAADTGRTGMGATLTAVLIHGTRAYVAEVGDSRAYLLRGQRFVQLTRDQSFAQNMLDAGAVTREELATLPNKNAILQAIGTRPSVVVAMNRFTVLQGDRILLCSDGLSGKVTDDEMRNVLLTTAILDSACSRLIDLANSRGGEDNITVVLFEMEGQGLAAPTGDERVSVETVQAFPG
jgi:PPM family protein phosphatase